MIVEKVKARKEANYGFDALKGEYGDMVEKGIIDPTKVARCALQNASSIAAILLTTESLVCDLPEKNPPPPPRTAPDVLKKVLGTRKKAERSSWPFSCPCLAPGGPSAPRAPRQGAIHPPAPIWARRWMVPKPEGRA